MFLSIFSIIDLYFLVNEVLAHLNPSEELAIPIKIPTNEVRHKLKQ